MVESELQSPMTLGFLGMLLGFFAKEVFGHFKSSDKEHTKAILANTLAITELKVEMKHLNEKLVILPALVEDVNAAHNAIREIRSANA